MFSSRGCNYSHGVLTELADSYIMLDQMEVYFGITEEELNAEIEYKLKRQLKRIAKRHQIETASLSEKEINY